MMKRRLDWSVCVGIAVAILSLVEVLWAGKATLAEPGSPTLVAGEEKAPPTLELRNGRWFDGTQFREATWYVVGKTLTQTPPSSVDERIDLAGGYVVPPFGEAHNHNVEGPWDIEAVTARYLRDGVFYVKNPNNIWEFTKQILSRLNKPTSLDVVFAHAGLTSSGGHPGPLYEDVLREARYRAAIGDVPAGWFDGRGYEVIDDLSDLDRKWTAILARKPNFLKVYLVHSERVSKSARSGERPRRKGLDPTLVPVIVARAHRDGLRVAAHVETAADFRTALASGVGEIAHMPGWYLEYAEEGPSLRLTDEDARAAALAGVVVTTTTVAMQPSPSDHDPSEHHAASRHKPGGHERPGHSMAMGDAVWREAERVQAHNLRLLHQHGVRIAIGSDHGETSLVEARHLHALDVFDNLTLLKLWCEATPQSIFPGRQIGRLDEGYEASVLVLTENPLDRFEAVTTIALRIKQGQRRTSGK